MNFIWGIFIILVIFIAWKIFLFVLRGGNFHLIPKNITNVYKTVKIKFDDEYDSDAELLFIAGMINAKMYIQADEGLIEKIYIAAESCSSLKDEVVMISDFSQVLMNEYFLQDSKMDSSKIASTIWDKRKDIDKSVERELENKKYFSENIIGKNIPSIKEYYNAFDTKVS
ncbi:MAG: hypothetical protein ACKUBY_01665 [Candidatus Moraniibacteriota bacterium]|jgi:hypothetical protein